MNEDELKALIAAPDSFAERSFEVMRELAHRHALAESGDDDAARSTARDLIIRCLERRGEMGASRVVHDALLARIGLYPYLDDPGSLGLGDRIAYEAHRPLVAPREHFVFHAMQAEVYARLMDGETVILTAPTSFGKTLIVDALIVSGRYDNVVVVVPTIALIDEVRRRLSQLNKRHELGFRIITHPGQTQGDRNIFVFTQERALEEESLPALDLSVIDEMYKLNVGRRDPERAALLNQALYRLRKLSRQMYLLGPNVGRIGQLPPEFGIRLMPSQDSTVAVDVIEVERSADERADLVTVCQELSEPTLVFVTSPKRATEVVRWLTEADIRSAGVEPMADWLAENYHPDWALVAALRQGIALHHGRLPRAVAHHLVSSFNEGHLRFLVCTSTLIEGVNTTAKNIVVLDDKIDRRRYDLFTFRNIQGRSGRMFKHFVGRVFLFNPPPEDPLLEIEIPVLSQPPDTPAHLLLAMDREDLTPGSRERIAGYLEQEELPVEVLRANAGVDLDAQIALAKTVREEIDRWAELLGWDRFPKWEQLNGVCELLFHHFPKQARRWGAVSASQLAFLVNNASSGQSPKQLIAGGIDYALAHDRTIDSVVLDVLGFYRTGLTFGFPRHLRVLDSIQRHVLPRAGHRPGDYHQYAAAAESSFIDGPLAALDEYGIPIELARRLKRLLLRGGEENLDTVLARLRELDTGALRVSGFERELIAEAKCDL